MPEKSLKLAAAAGGILVGMLMAPTPVAASCCQGYCACVDWQTGHGYAGCQISYDDEDNVIGVTCGYSGVE